MPRGESGLVEIGCSQPGLLGTLHDAARIDAVDPTAIVQMQSQWNRMSRSEGRSALALPAARRVNSGILRRHAVDHVVAELVEAKPACEQQPSIPKAHAFLAITGSIGDSCIGSRTHANWFASDTRIQTN